MQYSRSDGGVAPRYDEGEDMVRQLQANNTGVDDRLQQSHIQLFKNRQSVTADEYQTEGIDVPDATIAQSPGLDSNESDAESDGSEDDESEEDESEADESDEEEVQEDGAADAGPSFKQMPQELVEVQCDLFPNHCFTAITPI